MSRHRKLTPITAIRKTCYGCSAGAWAEVRNCPVTDCALFDYRMGKRPRKGAAKRTPLQAIKAYYLELQGGSKQYVREQPLGLPCDPWRFGKRPAAEQTYYDETAELTWFPWKQEEQEREPQDSGQNIPENEETPKLARNSESNSGKTTQRKSSRRSPSKRAASRRGTKPKKASPSRDSQTQPSEQGTTTGGAR